jgi:hypothetical protein
MVRGTIFSVKRAGPPHGPGVVVKQIGGVGVRYAGWKALVLPTIHPAYRVAEFAMAC